MIKFAYKREGDGEPLARLMTIRYLSREEMSWTLIAAVMPRSPGDLKELTVKEIEEAVRNQLEKHADAMNWWRDQYREQYEGETATPEEVEAWARAQVAKL